LFNSTIAGIDRADAILLVGTNPRLEAAVLNARILKRWRQGGLKVGVIGERAQLTYPYEYLGAGAQTLADVADGKHSFAETLKGARNPMVIIGAGAAARADGAATLGLCARIAQGACEGKEADWNGFNVLHTAAARVAGLDLGFVPQPGGLDAASMVAAAGKGELDVLYLLGADEIELPQAGSAFVIYQGSHGDRGAHRADVILPGAAYTEKDALYVNTEGRPQMTARSIFPPGEAREDWTIIRALSAALGQALPFDTVTELRAKMFAVAPQLALLDQVMAADSAAIEALAAKGGKPGKERFGEAITDFYLTNPIARASAIMASLSALHAGGLEGATGTHG
jgi:NADH-quinone oxidoreductase subunit G